MVFLELRERAELYLPTCEPPTGDGFFYPSLVVDVDGPQIHKALKEAEEALEQGRFQECEDQANRIHDANGDQAADALRLLWHCFRCCGRSRVALQMAQEAQQKEDLSPVGKSKMLLSRAELQLALGEAPEALKLATEALEAFRSHDLPSYEGFCLLVMASASTDLSQAEEWCEEAIEAFQEGCHSHGLGRALLQLAATTRVMGSGVAAAQKALEVFKFCKDLKWQAYTLQRMALLYWEEDDPENAVKKAEASMSILENQGPLELECEAQLAELLCAAQLRLGAAEVALRPVRSCLSRARSRDDRRIEAHMMLAAIGATQALSGTEAVMKTARLCQEIFEELGDRRMEAAALCALSMLYLQGDQLKEALAAAQEAMSKAREVPEAASRCAALRRAAAELCRARLRRREPRQAREALQMAIETVETMAEGRCHLTELKIQEAKVLMEMEDYFEAGQIIFQACKDCQHHGDWKGQARSLMMLSRVQMERGEYQKAMVAAEQASQLFGSQRDRLSEADALLLLSQAARSSVLSSPPEQSFVADFMPGWQAAKDALAIAQHLGEQLLTAFAALALARLQVLSKDSLKLAWDNAFQAAEIFALKGLPEDLAWSLEVQGFALYQLGYRDDAVEAIENAKAAFQQAPSSESHLRRCDTTLKQMQEKRSVEADAEPEQESLKAPRMPPVLETQPPVQPVRRERRVVQDLSLLQGQELVQAQLTKIMEDLGAYDVELDMGLQSAGLTSRAAVQMRSELEQTFGDLRYPATLAFDHPSIRQMSEWLVDAQQKHGLIAG